MRQEHKKEAWENGFLVRIVKALIASAIIVTASAVITELIKFFN